MKVSGTVVRPAPNSALNPTACLLRAQLCRALAARTAAGYRNVLGEGELTFVALVERVLRREPSAPVLGAMTRAADGSIVDGGFRPAIEELDALAPPDKDVVDTAIAMGRPVAVSLLTGRGCTHKCTFCTANTYLRLGGGVVWRRCSPEAVVDEMEHLVRTYGGRPGVHPMLQFQDVIFLGTSRAARAWTEAFVEELEQRRLSAPFYLMSRAEAIIANAGILTRLACAGLCSVEIGIESGIDRILLAYDKMGSAARTGEAIALLRAHDICYDASGFIMFDPRITLSELRDNAQFLRRLGHATWDRYVTKLQVFPGTAIRAELAAAGLYNDQGELDNVYAYRFEDPRVGLLARHVFMYGDTVRALDNAIHGLRAAVAERRRGGEDATGLRRAIEVAEDIYRDHFLSLVDLAERDELARGFDRQVARLLAQADVLARHLGRLSAPEIRNAA